MSDDDAGAPKVGRLVLEPLQVGHADEMVCVLADRGLYEFTGGEAPTRDALTVRYRALVAGSGDEGEQWCNWIMRKTETGQVIGFVQATIVDGAADIAWLVGVEHQRRGFASEAVRVMVAELGSRGIRRFDAHIHPVHLDSQRVAESVGLERSGNLDDDGEEIWTNSTEPSVPTEPNRVAPKRPN